MINIISNLGPEHTINNLYNFNTVVAWHLHDAFDKLGIDSRLVNDNSIFKKDPPATDHTLIVSSWAFVNFTLERWPNDKEHQKVAKRYTDRIRNSTKDKIAIYLDTNLHLYDKYVDLIFTVVEPLFPPENDHLFSHKEKYIYAGWGADPTLFYPEQEERVAFVDVMEYNIYGERIHKIYRMIENAFKQIQDLKLVMPIHRIKGKKRLNFVELAKVTRTCHYYLCTQPGESGLTRIEAATCGALILAHKRLYYQRTIGSLEHIVWDTEEDLIKALNTKTDPQKIREKALEHSWTKTAERIIRRLQN